MSTENFNTIVRNLADSELKRLIKQIPRYRSMYEGDIDYPRDILLDDMPAEYSYKYLVLAKRSAERLPNPSETAAIKRYIALINNQLNSTKYKDIDKDLYQYS